MIFTIIFTQRVIININAFQEYKKINNKLELSISNKLQFIEFDETKFYLNLLYLHIIPSRKLAAE